MYNDPITAVTHTSFTMFKADHKEDIEALHFVLTSFLSLHLAHFIYTHMDFLMTFPLSVALATDVHDSSVNY